jgi:hypothetical protein
LCLPHFSLLLRAVVSGILAAEGMLVHTETRVAELCFVSR